MKNVIAKINAAGVKTFYVDGKRISLAKLQAAFVDELKWDSDIVTARGYSVPARGAAFLVAVYAIKLVPYENSECAGTHVEFQFTVQVNTVSDGLKVALEAVKNPDVYQAAIYNAAEYNRNYRVWGHPSAIRVRADKIWTTCGRVYQSYLGELAAQNFQPVIACNAARAKSQALTAELEEMKRREHAAWREELDAQNARDAAVEAHLQSLIA